MSTPYFSKSGFALFRGDCRLVLEDMEPASVDVVFADPPYLLSNGGFTVKSGRRASVDKGNWDKSRGLDQDLEFHRQWIAAARRVLKPNGTLWVSGTYHSIYLCGFALQSSGFHVLNDIAWFKPNAAPNLACRTFAASHETLIWARTSKTAKHQFNYAELKRMSWPEDPIKKPNKQMRSVWSIPTPKKSEKSFGRHPTQKPFDLLRRIVIASTRPGDLVLDPFTGSSTTGVAALSLGRRFVGIDQDPSYLDLSVRRLTAELERASVDRHQGVIKLEP